MHNPRQENYERKSGLSKAIGIKIYAVVVTTWDHVCNSTRNMGEETERFNREFLGLCAYCCCPCFCCQVYNRAGECLCTPFFCCWPDSLMSLRMKIRTGFRLQVKISSWEYSLIFRLILGHYMERLSGFYLLSLLSIASNQ